MVYYHPGYTFVEKLQTIATKFRKEREAGVPNQNQMRQYYEMYIVCFLIKMFMHLLALRNIMTTKQQDSLK